MRSISYCCRLPATLVAAVKRLAGERRLTMSALVRVALEREIFEAARTGDHGAIDHARAVIGLPPIFCREPRALTANERSEYPDIKTQAYTWVPFVQDGWLCYRPAGAGQGVAA